MTMEQSEAATGQIRPPRVVTAPDDWRGTPRPRVFLSGSIEQGAAEPWQERAAAECLRRGWTVLNPRRADWDARWVHDLSDPRFVEQVEWELAGLEDADGVLAVFDPATASPITLLELGLLARSGRLVVVCPPGYWRRGNVQVLCRWYRIPLVDDLEAGLDALSDRLCEPLKPDPSWLNARRR